MTTLSTNFRQQQALARADARAWFVGYFNWSRVVYRLPLLLLIALIWILGAVVARFFAAPLAPAKRLQIAASYQSFIMGVACRAVGLHAARKGAPPPPGALLWANEKSVAGLMALASLSPALFVKHTPRQCWGPLRWIASAMGVVLVPLDTHDPQRHVANTLARLCELNCRVIDVPHQESPAPTGKRKGSSDVLVLMLRKGLEVVPVSVEVSHKSLPRQHEASFFQHVVHIARRHGHLIDATFDEPLRATSLSRATDALEQYQRGACTPRPSTQPIIEIPSHLKLPMRLRGRFKIYEGRYVVHIYDQPGRWGSQLFLDELSAMLKEVATQNDDGPSSAGLFHGERHAFSSRMIAIAEETETEMPVAFSTMRYLPIRINGKPDFVTHVERLWTAHSHRNIRLKRPIHKKMFAQMAFNQLRRSFLISQISSSPAAIGTISDDFSNVFPHYTKPLNPQLIHLEVASQLLNRYPQALGLHSHVHFDEDTFAISGVGKPLASGNDETLVDRSVKRYWREACNQFCHDLLDCDSGDLLLQIGQLHMLGVGRSKLSERPHPTAGK